MPRNQAGPPASEVPLLTEHQPQLTGKAKPAHLWGGSATALPHKAAQRPGFKEHGEWKGWILRRAGSTASSSSLCAGARGRQTPQNLSWKQPEQGSYFPLKEERTLPVRSEAMSVSAVTAQPPALSSLGGRVSQQGFPPLASSLWGQVLSCPGQWVRMRQKGVAGDQLQVCCSYTPVRPTPANTTLGCSLGQLRCGPCSQASGPSCVRTHLLRLAFFLKYMFCTACSPAHEQCEG